MDYGNSTESGWRLQSITKTHLTLQYNQNLYFEHLPVSLRPGPLPKLLMATISSHSLLVHHLTQDFHHSKKSLRHTQIFPPVSAMTSALCSSADVRVCFFLCFIFHKRKSILPGSFSSVQYKYFRVNSGKPCNFTPVQIPLTFTWLCCLTFSMYWSALGILCSLKSVCWS